MVRRLEILLGTLRSTVRTHRELGLENLALRQQLAVWKARRPRPRLTALDRIFWAVLSRLRKNWQNSPRVVRPATVVGWHRQGFRRYWAWKSRRPRGRPAVGTELFTVPTATFRVLFVLVMLTHSRCRLVHLNVAEQPTAKWTARQLLEGCALEEAPRYLIRDRDRVYGERLHPRSPWQNAYAGRVIGSIRRECVDHVIVIGEHHLRDILSKYMHYYDRTQTHYPSLKMHPSIGLCSDGARAASWRSRAWWASS